ncbi:MAG: carboxylating nicotinate-nucleotide diphosphorylase [Gammaproteobacteria bacterium]|nr:carboxylating nicotinate-nucleotide diphosphorylase [Gammaproteobacteria bacterium]
MNTIALPPEKEIIANARLALAEDLLPPGERSRPWPDTQALHALDPSLVWVKEEAVTMRLTSSDSGVFCGTRWFERCQSLIDADTRIDWFRRDADPFAAGEVLALVNGNSRSLLLAERSALNFLQLLSGTATLTHRFVRELSSLSADSRTRLLDTRKTLPGLRAAQKYAVRCGGGHNHRLGLYDAVMFKDNHLPCLNVPGDGFGNSPDIGKWRQWRQSHPDLEVIFEVEDRATLDKILPLQPNRILFDNLSPEELIPLVELARAHGIESEASGNIDISSIPAYATVGLDYISAGALTKNVEAADFSLRLEN